VTGAELFAVIPQGLRPGVAAGAVVFTKMQTMDGKYLGQTAAGPADSLEREVSNIDTKDADDAGLSSSLPLCPLYPLPFLPSVLPLSLPSRPPSPLPPLILIPLFASKVECTFG